MAVGSSTRSLSVTPHARSCSSSAAEWCGWCGSPRCMGEAAAAAVSRSVGLLGGVMSGGVGE